MASEAILDAWAADDQAAFSSYLSNTRYDLRNKLIKENPQLFKFCDIDLEEEKIKFQLYGLKTELLGVPGVDES